MGVGAFGQVKGAQLLQLALLKGAAVGVGADGRGLGFPRGSLGIWILLFAHTMRASFLFRMPGTAAGYARGEKGPALPRFCNKKFKMLTFPLASGP